MSCDTDHSPNFYVFGDLKCQKTIFGEIFGKQEDAMRPKNFKGGRCIKTKLKKCEEVARTYDKIQTAYADVLDKDKNIEVIKCSLEQRQNRYGIPYKTKVRISGSVPEESC